MHGQMNDGCVPDGNWCPSPIGRAQLSSRGERSPLAPPLMMYNPPPPLPSLLLDIKYTVMR